MFNSVAWAMAGQGSGGSGGSGMTAFLPLILMFAIFYFLLIRPQQKKAKSHKAMLAAVQKGDVIVTQGGIQGKVTGVTDAYLTVEIAEKVRVKVARNFISAKITSGEAPPPPPAGKN
ncbi:MAG: preprotein translocase subunit YajC [Deltaproteobacteria bacterium]|nr:preprotein translocase subunit YajC [Deltaproteobacteria bacterium]